MVRKDTRGRESLTDRAFGASARKGKQAKTLYSSLVHDLLEESGLLIGLAGTARSTYCFRHTYATMRLGEGIDVYLLAEQMGTSVQMIEEHYGHITPVKNADRILQGMYTWESVEEQSNFDAEKKKGSARVNKRAPAAKKSKFKPSK